MTAHEHEHDVHRAFLALILAVLDGDEHQAHAVIGTCHPFAVELAHYTAHKFVALFTADPEDCTPEQLRVEMRADFAAELAADTNRGSE